MFDKIVKSDAHFLEISIANSSENVRVQSVGNYIHEVYVILAWRWKRKGVSIGNDCSRRLPEYLSSWPSHRNYHYMTIGYT